MSVYVIFIRAETLDQAELDIYKAKAAPTPAGIVVQFLAAFGRQEVLEGPIPEGVAIAKFPSFEALRSWYNGTGYQQAAHHRYRGARYRAFAVEGLE
ncbi:DUF1330 domain-containing protein [Phyllobacterium endophyticum]|uniref:DUF1330 domain-containing protein n=1 Tax=Phyllobacterium endophyticum TaxID=1149773 RepID=A0A2P7ASU4_9HYPH|nr:DUF1330 domain-containing protein [Phyllobacterium endophyticum]MBB3236843.1 uncharacterized protein (DUF1330 family) [Phyllobacterium endophyticum]PSH57292.1 DUF1330 domain-containing protein [Phyllobacterium endophyticum]TYR40481.1 DUF1330 domain-containing protein [Phyllobacterium endophyticum]